MRRIVEPELLDELPSTDPRAVGSRADLRRLNVIMRHDAILVHAFHQHLAQPCPASRALRIAELGAGDGTLLLRLARRWSKLGVTAKVILIDRQDLVSEETRRAFTALGWSLETVATDVMTWLEQSSPPVDLMIANLFLHHFSENALRTLFRHAAARTNLFVACEPRRSTLALTASHLLWLIGCNAITRHDAAVSVRAGFLGHELSALWPSDISWELIEQSAGGFSHCFVAKKNV